MNPLRGEAGRLVKKSGAAFALQIGGAACSFGFSLLLAQRLGAAEAGVYFLALAVATVAATLGRLGMDQALVRFAAAEPGRTGGLYRRAGAAVAGGSALAAAALVLGAPGLASAFGEPGLAGPLRWMGGAVLGVNAAVLHAQLLKGIGDVRAGVFTEAFLRPAALLVGFAAFGAASGAAGATAAYLASGVVAAVSGWALWRRRRPSGTRGFSRAVLLRTALPLWGVSLLMLVLQLAPTLLLGLWSTTAAVAIYSVAFRWIVLTTFVTTAVNTVVGPQLAAAYARQDHAAVARSARRAALLTVAAAAPLLLLYAFAPAWTMGWFGPEFEEGATALVILTVGQVFNVGAGSAGQVLFMTGGERDVWWGLVLGVTVGGVLSVGLIPAHGVDGAAVAGAAALVLFNAYNVVVVRARKGFWTLGWTRPSRVARP